MTAPADLRPRKSPDPQFDVRETLVPQWQLNRFLYCLVGEQWAWVDKRSWTDEQWESYAASDDLRTFIALFGGSIAGYYELHRDETRAVEIAYFGLTPGFPGPWLWRRSPNRCDLARLVVGSQPRLGAYLHARPSRGTRQLSVPRDAYL